MSEKFEREIEEILRKMDSGPSGDSFRPRRPGLFQRWGAEIGYWLSGLRVTPTMVMVLSLVLFGLTVFLRGGMRQIALYVGLLAAVLFFTSIIMSARRSSGLSSERRWRGQLVELPGTTPWSGFRLWWARQRRRIGRWFNRY